MEKAANSFLRALPHRPLRPRARLLTAALAVYAAALLGSGYLALVDLDLLQKNAFAPVSDAEWEHLSERSNTVWWTAAAAFLVCGLLFLLWLHRASTEAHARGGVRYRPRWAILGFFVPVMNIWRPYLLVADLWQATDARTAGERRPPSPLLPLWWGAWIASTLLYTASAWILWGEELEEIVAGGHLAPILAFLLWAGLVLALLALVWVVPMILGLIAGLAGWVPYAEERFDANRVDLIAHACELFALGLLLALVWKLTAGQSEPPPARIVSADVGGSQVNGGGSMGSGTS